MAATADGSSATGNVKPDTQAVDMEKAAEIKTEQDVVHDQQQEEVQEKQQEAQQERLQETQPEPQQVEDEVEVAPALPPRPLPPPPPPHDEKRASLQQPPLVRFAALPPPLTDHRQPIQVYEP